MAKTAIRAAARKRTAPQTTEEIGTALRDLFLEEIKDIYWAEKYLTKALPKMQKAANSERLQQAFETHMQQTQEHVARLEKIFAILEEKETAKKCEAMAGLVDEAEAAIDDTEEGTATRDVALILAGQKVEHYEIATYGGLTQLAKTLELAEVADVLSETLKEEKDTDQLLTDIAESDINYEAKEEPVTGEEQ
jgi:ferritin-like metal-binding protein YciE